MMYEDENLVVKPSPIHGMGVFAKRAFSKDETVTTWKPTVISEEEFIKLEQDNSPYTSTLKDGTRVLMNPPERYINSSEEPNTNPVNGSDIALRDIAVGEEITSKYSF